MGSIVWIASYPRSGNTWTRTFLHNLLQVMRGEAAGPQDINAMHRLTTWDVLPRWWEGLLTRPLAEAGRAEVAALRAQVHRRIAEAADGVVFVKTHAALVLSEGHPTIERAVTAGAIYLVRNPLDAVISNAHHYGISLERAIEVMNLANAVTNNHARGAYEHFGAWWQNVDSWTRRPHRRLIVLRYEDLLADPAAEFRRLARHLGLTPGEAEISAAIERSRFERLQRQEDELGFRERPLSSERFFRAGRSEQWRATLTAAQVAAVVAGNRAQMERFGYLPEGF